MSRLFIKNDCVEIHIENEEDRAAAAQIPYVHVNRNRTKCWTSLLNINLVLRLFRGITINEIADKRPIKVFDRFIKTLELKTSGPRHSHEWLMKHQQLAVEIANVNPRFAFFYDTRT